MKRMVFVLVAFTLVVAMVLPVFGSSNVEYRQPASFWHWATGAWSPLDNFIGYGLGFVCPNSEDSYHHASSYYGSRRLSDGRMEYDCVCTYCGHTFTAYESDLKQSYDNQVSTLPAPGITSSGSIVWHAYDAFQNRGYVYCASFNINFESFSTLPFKSDRFNQKADLTLLPDEKRLKFVISSPGYYLYCGFYFDINAPISGLYALMDAPFCVSNGIRKDGSQTNLSESYERGTFVHYSVGELFSSPEMYVCSSVLDVVLGISYMYFPYYEIIPDTAIDITSDGQYGITTRPTSITGGNYGIIGDDGEIITITNNNQIINETNNTYYNPATGETKPILDWSYNYTDRSYKVTLESGDTYTITYGDENIVIKEGDVTYNIYYMVDGTGSGDPDPSPSVSVCSHVWTETSRTEPGCTSPGSASFSCEKCGEAKTDKLPATGHTWQVLRTVQTAYDEEGNLIQQGYTIYQCAVCSEQYKDDQGTGPPGGGDKDDDKETIWDKIGNFIGSIVDGIAGMVEAVLGKLLDALTALSEMLMGKVKDVVEVVLSIFDELPQLFGGFLDFLGIVFPFLPSEITLLLTFGVIAVVFIGIIKAIRR